MRIAVIADIHSNDIALAAVMDDFRKAGVDRVIHLGDAFNGPINPQGVAKLLKAVGVPISHVRGNGERMVLGVGPESPTKTALFAREKLLPGDLMFAATWPAVVRGETFLACHGSPRSDTEYLLEDVTPLSGARQSSVEKDEGRALGSRGKSPGERLARIRSSSGLTLVTRHSALDFMKSA